ncbi:MAG: helix-turn-helix transcriptional regulator [Acidimicrobiia bacterium]
MLAPRNYLQGCLLLLLAEFPSHGYELVERVSDLGIPTIDPPAVYRALRAMSEDGLLESSLDDSGPGPTRRCYRVSDSGAAALEAWAATVNDSASSLNSFVTRHRQLVAQA